MLAILRGEHRLFLMFALLLGMLIGAEYAVVRPVSHSLFLQAYGVKALPFVWICSLPWNFCLLAIYHKLLSKFGCKKTFQITGCAVFVGNMLVVPWIAHTPLLVSALYIWKEAYIMLMLQQLWSLIHATLSLREAQSFYGILFGFGAIGGFLGSLVPGFFAVQFGSENLLLLSGPLYILILLLYSKLFRKSMAMQAETPQRASLRKSSRLILASPLLIAIVIMTLCMQSTCAFTDFQFQSLLENIYPDKDLRTEYFGKILALGNVLTMTCQFFLTYLCIKFFGIYKSHLMIPIVLLFTQSIFLFIPSLHTLAACFLLIKCFDFSFFGVIKEMLYVNMKKEEKFLAKACIDVFVHRTSKVCASLLILSMTAWVPHLVHKELLILGNLCIFILWTWLLVFVRKYYPIIRIPARGNVLA